MKTISLFFSMMLLVICMSACKGGPTVSKATGSPGDLIVVMEKASWTGSAGLALKDLLSSDVPGLTQPEPVMNVSYTEPKHFDRMFQMVRNILVVEIDPTMYTKATGRRLKKTSDAPPITPANPAKKARQPLPIAPIASATRASPSDTGRP